MIEFYLILDIHSLYFAKSNFVSLIFLTQNVNFDRYDRNRNKKIQSYKENKTYKQPVKKDEVKIEEEKDSSIDVKTMEEFRKLMGG